MSSTRRPSLLTPTPLPAPSILGGAARFARAPRPAVLTQALDLALGRVALPAPAMVTRLDERRRENDEQVRRATVGGSWTGADRTMSRSSRRRASRALTGGVTHHQRLLLPKTGQAGFALVELLLVVGSIMLATGAIYGVYTVVDGRAKTQREVENATQVTQNIVNFSVAAGNFASITQEGAITDHLFPDRMTDGAGNPRSAWGNDVTLSSIALNGQSDFGVALTYDGVPASACSTFVKNASPAFYEVRIENTVLRTNYGDISPATLATLCNRGEQGARVQLIYAKNAGTGVASDPLADCSAPAPETITGACPAGQTGAQTQQREFTCLSPYGAATASAWTVINSTCAPACVLPSPSSQTNQETRTASQTLTCPGGQMGEITQNRNESRQQTREASCPPVGQSGGVVWGSYGAFSPWAGTSPWVTTLSTCAPACTLPSPSTETETSTRTGTQTLSTCPPGQQGTITQTRTETQSRSRTASCPAPTGNYVWSGYTPYSAWVGTTPWATTTSTCAPTCVVPTPSSVTNSETRTGTQNLTCAPGYLGGITQSRPERRDQTATYSCPAPTGSATLSPYSAFGSWYGTGPWTTTTDTCAVPCTLPSPSTQTNSETRTGTQSLGCPADQSGSITQTRSEKRDQTRTASCPAPTGSYTWGAYTPFGAWYGTSPWTTSTNTCAPNCTLPSPSTETQFRSAACPPYYTGSATESQSRTASCPAPTGPYSWGAYSPWAAYSSTCALPVCGSQAQNENNYMARYPDVAVAFGGNGASAYQHWYQNGYYEGRVSCWGPPCVLPSPATQTNSETRVGTQSLGCPAGSTGSITQSRNEQRDQTRSASCPSPTTAYTWGAYGAFGAWYGTSPWTTTANTCKLDCTVPANTSYSWTGDAGSCGPKSVGTSPVVLHHGESLNLNYTRSNKIGITSGSATFLCVNGTVSPTATTATCIFESL